MKKFIYMLLLMLLMLLFVAACGDDDDPTGPSGPSKDGAVLISGSGSSTEFDTFEFVVIPFFNWLIISAIEGSDTLTITLFDFASKQANSAISLTDSSLFVIGTFGSGKLLAMNFNLLGKVSGNITFTSLDSSGSIAATFSSGATLETIDSANSSSTATIAGDFVATKATGASLSKAIVRRELLRRSLK